MDYDGGDGDCGGDREDDDDVIAKWFLAFGF